jgi:hypothetical protein
MAMKYRILCTGNPKDRGIAQSISKIFPDAEFISRTNGFNLTLPTEEIEKKFREKLKNYNVFINNAYIAYGCQEHLLKIVREEWGDGHVFNIGTLDEYEKWAWREPEYTEEKRRLRELGIELGNEKFKTTHIIVGGFQALTPGSLHTMDPIHIAESIKWILEAPFEVPIIGIQQMTDYIRAFYDRAKAERGIK